MAQITFEVEDSIAYALAVARGWSPTIDDETQDMDGDNYPQVPNPVTFQQFVSEVATETITEYVLSGGRDVLITQFKSTFNNLESQIKSGTFDQLILKGAFDQIKELVKAGL